MKWLQKTWIIWLAVGIVGCEHHARVRTEEHVYTVAPLSAPRASYHYVYYPNAQIYFDPERRTYWWFEDGAWRSGPSVPTGMELGASVNFDLGVGEPWRQHEEIVRKYPRRTVVVEERPAAVTTTYHYVYYPDVEVYYEPTRRLYWWREGDTWQTSTSLPPRIRLGHEVQVELDVAEPWRQHEVIIQKYPRHMEPD